MPLLSVVGGVLSWIVLAVWWDNAAAAVGVLPSLLVLVGLTLMMLGGHAWAHAQARRHGPAASRGAFGFRTASTSAWSAISSCFFVAQQPAMVGAAVAAVRRARRDDAGGQRRRARRRVPASFTPAA